MRRPPGPCYNTRRQVGALGAHRSAVPQAAGAEDLMVRSKSEHIQPRSGINSLLVIAALGVVMTLGAPGLGRAATRAGHPGGTALASAFGAERTPPMRAAVSLPSTLTILSRSATVTAGRSTLVTALIDPAHANQGNVYLQQRRTTARWSRVARMYWSPRLRRYYWYARPTSIRFYRAVWYGDSSHASAISNVIKVQVYPRLRFVPSPSNALWGQRITLAGSVYPNHYGKRVYIQIRAGSGWSTLYALRLSRRSTFGPVFKPRLKGTYVLRAYLPKPDWDHLSAMTGTRTIKVTQGAINPEGRAVWVTRWNYRSPLDIKRIMRSASEANLNIVYFQVRGAGDAYYRSHYEPWAARLTATSRSPRGWLGKDPGWDPLQVAIDHAHANGLKLHAWINVFPMWMGTSVPATSYPTTSGPVTISPAHIYYKWSTWRVATRYKRNGRWYYPTQRLNRGYLWATPGNSEVRDHIHRVAMDIVSNYDVDGLHLDKARYPGSRYSWDAPSRTAYAAANAAYKASHGGRSLPRSVWQRRCVTSLVGRIYGGTKDIDPAVQVSAAVSGIYVNRFGWPGIGGGLGSYYEDSQVWADAGYVDFLAPLTFYRTGQIPRWGTVVSDFVSHRDGRGIYAGIGAFMFKGNWSELQRQVEMRRGLSAQGVSFFDNSALGRRWVKLSGLFPLMVDPPVRGTQTALSLESTTTTPSVDETITLFGTLLPMQAARTVYVRRFDATHWDLVGSDATDANSKYAIPFRGTVAGTYRLRAVFKGDSTYAGATSQDLVITTH